MPYTPSVGMEVHAELLTRTKMFCRCPNAFGGEVNTRVCPVCLGLPGSLPVINKRAVEHVLRTALALNCQIAKRSLFHRKNYFYPDLPKGYQDSQYGEFNPIGHHGYLEIPVRAGHERVDGDSGKKRVRIARVHLEEDTGKLMHLPSGGSGVDYNRAGVPLMEIVTAFPPDIHSVEEARDYLHYLRLTLIYLGACDGKMEQGSFRCEPNISVSPDGSGQLGVKTELKNLSSFKAVSLGIKYEVDRMISALEAGRELRQETRGWDEPSESSYPMRVKEREHDYRYFPDPDLPPMIFSEEQLEVIRGSLPELPLTKRERYMTTLGLNDYDAGILIADPGWAQFFDEAVQAGGDAKQVCNWMNSDFARLLNETGHSVDTTLVKPSHIASLVQLVQAGTISGKMAKEVFAKVFKTGKTPSQVVEEEGLRQITDEGSLRRVVLDVLNENEDVVDKYKQGKQTVRGFLVGQVMKKTRGQANPELVNRLIDEELSR